MQVDQEFTHFATPIRTLPQKLITAVLCEPLKSITKKEGFTER
jgi:hypothetical protein